MGKGILSDLKDKVEDKESSLHIRTEDVEIKLPFGKRVRLGGDLKLDKLKIGFKKRKKKEDVGEDKDGG
jgi:hypothetical protein